MRNEPRPSGTTQRGGSGPAIDPLAPRGAAPAPAGPAGKATTGSLGLTPEEEKAAVAGALPQGMTDAVEDPLVFDGKNPVPLSRMDLRFYAQTREQLIRFQMQMQAAGRLPNPRFGDYDDDTVSLWRRINEQAAGFYAAGKKNFTPTDVIAQMVANAPDDPEDEKRGRQGRSGFIDGVMNKVDLEEQIQQAARGRLNRKLNPKEVAKFVAVYQTMQKASFKQANAATLAAEGGEGMEGGVDGAPGRSSTLVAPVGIDAASQQFIDSNFAQEAAGVDTLGAFSVIERMLAGGN